MEKRIHLQRSNLVGVIHTEAGFAEAGNPGLDAVEVRVDALPHLPSLQQVAALSVPAILTVRACSLVIACLEQHGATMVRTLLLFGAIVPIVI